MLQRSPVEKSRAPPNKHLLNDRFIGDLQAKDKPYLVWDTKQSGLAVRVEPTGYRSFKCVTARQIAQMITIYRKRKDFNYRDYAELLKQQSAESSAIMRLSRSLRLTQQSVMDRKMKHPRGGAMIGNPWDRDEE